MIEGIDGAVALRRCEFFFIADRYLDSCMTLRRGVVRLGIDDLKTLKSKRILEFAGYFFDEQRERPFRRIKLVALGFHFFYFRNDSSARKFVGPKIDAH